MTLRSGTEGSARRVENRGPEREHPVRVMTASASARRRAWAPLGLRAGALALALLGLAAIGSAASRAPQPTAAPAAGVGLAALSGRLAALGGGGSLVGFPVVSEPPGAELGPESAAGEAPDAVPAAAASALAVPCPCGVGAAAPAGSPRAPLRAPPRAVVPSSPPEARVPAPASGVPSAPAPPTAPRVDAVAAHEATSSGIAADGRVALNRAGVGELMRLPGVGAKRAAAIVELRQRLGRFRQLNDLLRIKGIGPRTLERMLPELVLD